MRRKGVKGRGLLAQNRQIDSAGTRLFSGKAYWAHYKFRTHPSPTRGALRTFYYPLLPARETILNPRSPVAPRRPVYKRRLFLPHRIVVSPRLPYIRIRQVGNLSFYLSQIRIPGGGRRLRTAPNSRRTITNAHEVSGAKSDPHIPPARYRRCAKRKPYHIPPEDNGSPRPPTTPVPPTRLRGGVRNRPPLLLRDEAGGYASNLRRDYRGEIGNGYPGPTGDLISRPNLHLGRDRARYP